MSEQTIDSEALVRTLVEKNNGPELQRLAAAGDKVLAKAARRGLHLLKSRGATLPSEKKVYRPPEEVIADDDPVSLVSMIDGRGERIVWLADPVPNGYEVHQAELSESNGIFKFASGQAARKSWRERIRESLAEPGISIAPVPGRHVRHLLERAYQQNLAKGRSVPDGFAEARLGLGVSDRIDDAAHPALKSAAPLSVKEARGRLSSLHDLIEVTTWIPPRDALETLDRTIGEISTSKLVIDPAQRMSQLQEKISSMADALPAEWRAQMAERLRETAYLLTQRGKHLEEARLCMTAAALLDDPAEKPSENPFVVRLFEKLVERQRLD